MSVDRKTVLTGLVWLGLGLVGLAALAAQGLTSIPHLVGAGLALAGLVGLAATGGLPRALWPDHRAFWALFALVAVGYGVLIWASYESMSFPYADTGYAAERIGGLAEHGTFYLYTLGRHGLADHWCPLLTVFVPLWKLWPTFLWFPIAKVVAFLLTAVLLQRLGRELLGPGSKAVWVLPCLWLVHVVVGYGVLFDFQTDHLAPPLIVGAFLAAHRRRWLVMALCLVVLVGLKENMGLVWICLGLWLAMEQGRRRLGLGIATAGVVIGCVVFFVLMPLFSEGVQVHESRFGPFAYLPEKALAIAVCFLSLGALPLARPKTLLWVAPIFALHLVSRFPNMFSFRYHYFMTVMAVLFIAALYGLRDVLDGRALPRPTVRRWALALGGAAIIGLNGWLPIYPARLRWPTPESMQVKDALLDARAALPLDVDVFAGFGEGLYLLPHPRLVVAIKRTRLPDLHAPHVVVFSRLGTPWYAPADVAPMIGELEREAAAGAATPLVDNAAIVVYRRDPR